MNPGLTSLFVDWHPRFSCMFRSTNSVARFSHKNTLTKTKFLPLLLFLFGTNLLAILTNWVIRCFLSWAHKATLMNRLMPWVLLSRQYFPFSFHRFSVLLPKGNSRCNYFLLTRLFNFLHKIAFEFDYNHYRTSISHVNNTTIFHLFHTFVSINCAIFSPKD